MIVKTTLYTCEKCGEKTEHLDTMHSFRLRGDSDPAPLQGRPERWSWFLSATVCDGCWQDVRSLLAQLREMVVDLEPWDESPPDE